MNSSAVRPYLCLQALWRGVKGVCCVLLHCNLTQC